MNDTVLLGLMTAGMMLCIFYLVPGSVFVVALGIGCFGMAALWKKTRS